MPRDTSAFDRAAPLRKDLDFLEGELRRAESRILPVWRDLNLIHEDQLVQLPMRDAGELLESNGELVWLGRMQAASYFALDLSDLAEPKAHVLLARGEFQDLRLVGGKLPSDQSALAAYARGMLSWHSRHPRCSVCGQQTAPRDGGHVRACRNQDCAALQFPRTDPAVIVLVRDEDRCLLGRQRAWPTGMYSTLAGFVEPGETLEEAVVREIEEETGVLVEDVRYFGSQPWPFPASLMIGFTARATTREIRLADDELQDAGWFDRDQLRNPQIPGFFVPGKHALAGKLIGAFLDEHASPEVRTNP